MLAQEKNRQPTETTALNSQAARNSSRYEALCTGLLMVTMVCFSTGLINFNKWLMDASRFPFAVPLVLFHMVFCSFFAFLLKLVCPSLFPALTDPDKRITVNMQFIIRGCLPIAVFFSTALVLTNLAYTRLSVAFLQMIKQSNLIWTYGFSLVFALEKFSWEHVKLIMIAIFGTILTVKGELHFVLIGFVVQVTSIIIESVRLTLQAILLQGKKLDPLSYVYLMSPISAVILLGYIGILRLLPDGYLGQGLSLPSIPLFIEWLPVLTVNAMVAFGLNVSVALILQQTSPMAYLMCCLVKDVAIVLIGVFVLGEMVTGLQYFGSALQLGCALFWSLLKSYPKAFSGGLLAGSQELIASRNGAESHLETAKSASASKA